MSSRESPDDGVTDTDGSRSGSGDTDEPADDSEFPLTRRQAIAGGGVAVILGAGLGASHVLRPARAVHPDIPDEALESNGWVRIAETSETVLDDAAGPVTVEAIASTVQYENRGLVQEALDTPVEIEYRGQTTTETLGNYVDEFDRSMGVFAATKIDVTPHIDELPGGLGRAEVMDRVETQAREQFEQQLREAGLGNVTQTATGTTDIDTGQAATLVEYRATFTFEATEATVQGATIDIPGDEIEIAGYLAIWHNGRNVLIGAGAHPNENHEQTVTDTVQGAELTLSFDLDLTPSSLRAELLGYITRIE